MNKKKLISAIIIVLIVLVLIIVAVLVKTTSKTNQGDQSDLSSQNSKTKKSGQITQTNGNGNGNAATNLETVAIESPIPASLGLMPGSPEAPKQEKVEANNIPTKAVKLEVSDKGFSPKEFTIKAGAQISLAITAVDSNTHVFLFPSASLMALTVMVSGGETKVINFTAPNAGTYTFRDDIPTFRANTGTMIVK